MSGPFKMKGFPSHAGVSPAKQKPHPAGTGFQNLKNLKQDKPKKKKKELGFIDKAKAFGSAYTKFVTTKPTRANTIVHRYVEEKKKKRQELRNK